MNADYIMSTEECQEWGDAQAAYSRNLAVETPAKTWWSRRFDDPLIAQALKVDRTEPDAWYALLPFRYMPLDGKHIILAAYPPPRALDDIDDDWLRIDIVLAWEPRTGTVEVMGDHHPQVVGHMSEDANSVFSDPRAFFTAWAARRFRYLALRRSAKVHRTAEPDLVPGLLVVGDITKVAWPIYHMPARINAIGMAPRDLNRAIFNFAKLPMAIGDRRDGLRD